MKKIVSILILLTLSTFAKELAYCATEEMDGSSAKCYTISTSPKYLTNHVGNMSKDNWDLVSVLLVKGMNGLFYKFYFQRGE